MIRCGLDRCAKFVPFSVKALAARASDDCEICPGFDFELHEHDSIGVEEEEDFVQPVHDSRSIIGPVRLEVALFHRTERSRVHKDTNEPLRSRDERLLARSSAREYTDV